MKILLVEPDRLLAKVYSQALESKGHHLVSASTAQEGIAKVDEFKPDLIILEIQLVEHSGVEFMHELRSYEDWLDIPVIINSMVPPAEFNHSFKILKHELKVSDYLYKPDCSLKTLLAKVSNFDPVLK